MLRVRSGNQILDDDKKYHNIVEEAEIFNKSVLNNHFNYNKLTLNVLTCQLRHYEPFYTES
jgi:hypothetical protein